MVSVKRKEIWWVNFDPSIAGEIQKTRPAVIVSNDFSNAISNRVQAVPLTSDVEKCYPCEAYISNNNKKSKAMADQIMTISKNRLKTKIGVITDRDMRAVEMAIKVQLSLQS